MLYNNKGFASLLGIMITLVIIGYLIVKSMDSHVGSEPLTTPTMDKETKEELNSAGIDTSTKQSTLNSAVSQIQAIDERNRNRGNDLLDQMSGQLPQ